MMQSADLVFAGGGRADVTSEAPGHFRYYYHQSRAPIYTTMLWLRKAWLWLRVSMRRCNIPQPAAASTSFVSQSVSRGRPARLGPAGAAIASSG